MKKFRWYLSWINGNSGEEQTGPVHVGTEEEFDYWWECLDTSTKQITDLHYMEVTE